MLSVLAESPHGRTYRAQGPAGVVALKELVFALVPTAEQLDAFEREAKVLESISHPQVPRFVESFREGEGPALRLYLAQELVEGEPLSDRLRAGAIDEAEARAIARPAHRAWSLKAAHESIVLLKNEANTLPLRKDIKTIAVVGPNADAPEVLLGNYNGRPSKSVTPLAGIKNTVTADTKVLYALGATLVHLLGRKAPADTLGPDLELRLGHLQISPGFRSFLGRLTARRRGSRPASAAEALRILDSPVPVVGPVRARLPLVLAGAFYPRVGEVTFPGGSVKMAALTSTLIRLPGAVQNQVLATQPPNALIKFQSALITGAILSQLA